MSPPPMTCAEAEPLLPLVADGAVDPDSEPALFAHLAACPACQEAVARHDLVTLALERAAARPRRQAKPVLRLWLAAAAVLAIGAGALAWWSAAAPPPQAEAATAPAIVETAPAAPTEPEVVRAITADGRAVWMVRRDGGWVVIDPAAVDGPARPRHGGGAVVPVRY